MIIGKHYKHSLLNILNPLNRHLATFIFIIFGLNVQIGQAMPAVQQPCQVSTMDGLFIENKGQVFDQYQKPNNEVLYLFANGLFNLQLKQNGFSYELFEIVITDPKSPTNKQYEYDPFNDDEDDPAYQFHSSRVDVTFTGAATEALIPSDPSEASFNYYTVNCGAGGITGVPGFYQVTYKNVYPGIDLVFHAPDGENASLKYEWIVKPGADASAIQMQFEGAMQLQLQQDGSIDVLMPKGKINEGKIYACNAESGAPVDVTYQVKKNTISYQGIKTNSNTLVIDPNIIWFSYYGGPDVEDLFEGEMAIDGSGSPLLAGNTSSASYIASTGAYQVTYGDGGVDGFVAKFKPNGQLAWATYYGGDNRDGCHSIVADADKNVFVGGNTYSDNGIATAGSHQDYFGGSMDAFLAKFDKKGIRLWATYYGGTGYGDQINGLDCDANGNIYFAGYTCSPNNISTPGAYQEVYNGVDDVTGDVMVGEFTNDGVRVWASYLSGPGQDRAHDLVLLPNGDFYIEGTCESTTGLATPDIYQSTYGGGLQDVFLAKWHADGGLAWCTYYGGELEEHGRGLAIDSSGNAYMGGWTISTTGIGTPGSAQPDWFPGYNNQGIPSADAYLAKFNPDGFLEWGTYYGGKDLDRSRGIAVEKQHDFVYVVGQTNSKTNVANVQLFKPDTGFLKQDGFVSKYSAGGELIYTYLVGGNGAQTVFDADLDPSNSLYLFMTTDQTFYSTAGVYQGVSNGDIDVMLIKMNPGDSCTDQNEPNNNTYLTAPDIKPSIDTLFFGTTGVITEANDEDWFRIKTPPTNLKIQLLDLVADYDIYLYKANGQLIASSTQAGATDETIILNALPKGKYYLKIVAAGNDYQPNACYRVRALSSQTPWLLRTMDPALLSNQLDMQVFLYPNPVSDLLNVKITSPVNTVANTTIFDLSNKMIASESHPITAGTQTISFDVKGIASGLYLFQIESNGKHLYAKINVQH